MKLNWVKGRYYKSSERYCLSIAIMSKYPIPNQKYKIQVLKWHYVNQIACKVVNGFFSQDNLISITVENNKLSGGQEYSFNIRRLPNSIKIT